MRRVFYAMATGLMLAAGISPAATAGQAEVACPTLEAPDGRRYVCIYARGVSRTLHAFSLSTERPCHSVQARHWPTQRLVTQTRPAPGGNTCHYVEVPAEPSSDLRLRVAAYGYGERGIGLSASEQRAATPAAPRMVLLFAKDDYVYDEQGCPAPLAAVSDENARWRYARAQVADGLSREGGIDLEARVAHLGWREEAVVQLLSRHRAQLDGRVRMWIDDPEQREALELERHRRQLLEQTDPEHRDPVLELLRREDAPRLPQETTPSHPEWRRFDDAVRQQLGEDADPGQLRRSMRRLQGELQGTPAPALPRRPLP